MKESIITIVKITVYFRYNKKSEHNTNNKYQYTILELKITKQNYEGWNHKYQQKP